MIFELSEMIKEELVPTLKEYWLNCLGEQEDFPLEEIIKVDQSGLVIWVNLERIFEAGHNFNRNGQEVMASICFESIHPIKELLNTFCCNHPEYSLDIDY